MTADARPARSDGTITRDPQSRVPVRTIAATIAMVLLTAAVLLLGWEVRRVLTWIVVAVLLAIILGPLVDLTERRLRLRRVLATLLVFLVAIVALAGRQGRAGRGAAVQPGLGAGGQGRPGPHLARRLVLLLAVVPLLGSLAWIRRFHRLAGLIETEADYAQQQRERANQEAELASTIAARLRADNVETAGGVLLRTLLHPAEGVVGGDFLGTARAGEAVWFVIGDVTGHGLEAAVTALRLKDLVLSAVLAGSSLADALAMGNALLLADPSGEALATMFVPATATACCATPTPATCPAIWSMAAPVPPSGSWHPPGRCLAWSSIR